MVGFLNSSMLRIAALNSFISAPDVDIHFLVIEVSFSLWSETVLYNNLSRPRKVLSMSLSKAAGNMQ